jgi:hypothetical protein
MNYAGTDCESSGINRSIINNMQQSIDRHSKYNGLPHYSVEQSISTYQWFASHAADFEESIFDARITAQH